MNWGRRTTRRRASPGCNERPEQATAHLSDDHRGSAFTSWMRCQLSRPPTKQWQNRRVVEHAAGSDAAARGKRGGLSSARRPVRC